MKRWPSGVSDTPLAWCRSNSATFNDCSSSLIDAVMAVCVTCTLLAAVENWPVSAAAKKYLICLNVSCMKKMNPIKNNYSFYEIYGFQYISGSQRCSRPAKKSGMKAFHPISFLASLCLLTSHIHVHAQTTSQPGSRAIHVGQLASVTNPLTSAMASQYIAGIYSLAQVSAEALIKDVGSVAASGVMLTQLLPEPGKPLTPVLREFHAELAKPKRQADSMNWLFTEPAEKWQDSCKPAVGMCLALLR